MRPTPGELISHVRTVLRDVVEPEVRSEYARTRLREIRASLAQVDWDNAAIMLAQDTKSLRELLTDCLLWIEDASSRATHFGSLLADLKASVAEQPDTEQDFAAYNERHARYAAAVVAMIDPLEDWLRANPDDETGQRLRQNLLARATR